MKTIFRVNALIINTAAKTKQNHSNKKLNNNHLRDLLSKKNRDFKHKLKRII